MTDLIPQGVVPSSKNIPYGECSCGCGQKTAPSVTPYKHGRPTKCIPGHQGIHRRPVLAQPDDPAIRYIALTQGKVAVVDTVDYGALMQHNWCARLVKPGYNYYAIRSYSVGGVQHNINMHSAVLGPSPEGTVPDHIDGDTLNNRRANLRHATHSESTRNRSLHSNNTTGFRGVSRQKKYFCAFIMVNSKSFYLGHFKTAEKASEAYEAAALKYHGDFRRKD